MAWITTRAAGDRPRRGPKGDKYNYEKTISASQLPGGRVAGNYTIWVKDGNGERDSQNQTFTLHGNHGLVWLVFDQNRDREAGRLRQALRDSGCPR